MKVSRVLSTKVLSPIQKNRIIEMGCSYVEQNFIETQPLSFSNPLGVHSLLFSSQNAVKYVTSKKDLKPLFHPPSCINAKSQKKLKTIHY